MKKSVILKAIFIFIAASTIAACTKSQTDVPQVTTALSMTGSASAPTVAKASVLQKIWDMILPSALAFMPASLVDSNGTSVTLTDAWIMMKDVEFKTEEASDSEEVDGSEVEFAGPYAVDLLSATPVTLDSQLIPQQPYKRIKMKLHKADSAIAGAPAGLLNNSIYLAGSVGANAFTYQSDDTTEFEVGGPNSVLPADDGNVVIEIQLANVIKQIDLSVLPNGAAVTSSNRYAGANLCPSIDASAADVYSCLQKGLRNHTDWGCDRNGDNNLDSNDDSVK